MNADLQQQVQRVNEKLQQLLKQYVYLQKEKEQLAAALEEVTKLNELRSKELDGLAQKVAILKSATNSLSETDKKELGKRLNRYIKDIDKCISLFST
jgi:chaperonin cofactor prefoldin